MRRCGRDGPRTAAGIPGRRLNQLRVTPQRRNSIHPPKPPEQNVVLDILRFSFSLLTPGAGVTPAEEV